jgi:uncharacterized protein YaeQ
MIMAQQATVYRFNVQLSHVDRGVYDTLDLRMARHPSETERFLLTRLIAYCHLVEEGLEFSKGGLSSPDEPALSIKSLDGRQLAWIEIGNPSAERLHKAAKACKRVVVVTHHDVALLLNEVSGKKVHRVEEIEVIALEPSFLDRLARHIGDRGCAVEVTISEGELYATAGGEAIQTTLRKVTLA